jgi:hypothetical protein
MARTPHLAPVAAACVVALFHLGCGARSSLGSGEDAACPVPATLGSQTCRLSTTRCALGGVDPLGIRYEMVCDGTSCTWKKDGRVVCDCGQLDYANTCAAGFAMCAEWRPPFNFSTLECVWE